MDLKPRIFIGSSGEGLEVAKYVKSYLSADFDCYLWTDDIFKFNESILETLLKEASLFDFGLLIATKDDFLQSRNNAFDAARDNVVFEYGLFLGRVGSSRAFVIQEEGTKLPSDYLALRHHDLIKKLIYRNPKA
jgi:predicted nucleotide-binding protein